MRDGEFSASGPGFHAAEETATSAEDGFTISAGQLRAFIERIERLEEEKKEVADQIKEVVAEAKANGFDVKTLRKIVTLRRKKPEERSEEQAMLDLYLSALGMAV